MDQLESRTWFIVVAAMHVGDVWNHAGVQYDTRLGNGWKPTDFITNGNPAGFGLQANSCLRKGNSCLESVRNIGPSHIHCHFVRRSAWSYCNGRGVGRGQFTSLAGSGGVIMAQTPKAILIMVATIMGNVDIYRS